jgi:hypothetical protein
MIKVWCPKLVTLPLIRHGSTADLGVGVVSSFDPTPKLDLVERERYSPPNFFI